MRELKEYRLDPNRFSRLGASLHRGCCWSAAGHGKTLLTKTWPVKRGPFQVVSTASLSQWAGCPSRSKQCSPA